MNPREATDAEVAYWNGRDGNAPVAIVMGGPEEGPDVIPCPCLLGHSEQDNTRVVHVAYQLDEIEVAHLARGATLWLSTYGGLPIHRVEVVSRDDLSCTLDDDPSVPVGPVSAATSDPQHPRAVTSRPDHPTPATTHRQEG